MIAIVDYEAGNLTSVEAAVSALGYEGRVTADPEEIACAERVIFPGVGAAGSAMASLQRLGLPKVLRETVACGKPFLGIRLGYQSSDLETRDSPRNQSATGSQLRLPANGADYRCDRSSH